MEEAQRARTCSITAVVEFCGTHTPVRVLTEVLDSCLCLSLQGNVSMLELVGDDLEKVDTSSKGAKRAADNLADIPGERQVQGKLSAGSSNLEWLLCVFLKVRRSPPRVVLTSRSIHLVCHTCCWGTW